MRLTDEERQIADDQARYWFAAKESAQYAWERALEFIAARRKAFGEADTPGTATAAGVAAPPAEASDEVVAWMVEGGAQNAIRAWDTRSQADLAAAFGGTVVPLVRQASPRGVVVTEAQRGAVEWAIEFAQANSFHTLAKELSSLLATIDAAKGGET